jgi:thiosulfate reductase cytochrome b subunit
MSNQSGEAKPGAPPPRRILVPRHALIVRITHWINVIAFTLLLLSGLAIFNAHSSLNWGQKTDFSHSWLSMSATYGPHHELVGHTQVGGAKLDTTGVLGVSPGLDGQPEVRGFPKWLTLPPYRSLAEGRRWHFFFAWVLVLNGLLYLVSGVLNRHFSGDLWVTKADIASIPHEIVTHAQLKFPKGEEARRYNVLQKLAYLSVVFLLFPLLILAGWTMSPMLDAGFHLPDLMGGRQSARSIHFIVAWLLVAFVALHLFMVLVSGVWNNLRSMITGRYAIEVEGDDHGA